MLKRTAVLLGAALLLPCVAQGQMYVGMEVGWAETDQAIPFDFPTDTVTNDDTEEALKLFFGYRFHPNLALELGYADLSDDYTTFNVLGDGEATRMGVEALYCSLVGSVSVAPKVDLFGRLGVASWDVDLEYSVAPDPISAGSGDGVNLLVGLGFEWNVVRKVALRFEWEQFQNVGDGVTTNRPQTGDVIELNGQDINVMGVAVVYRFGGGTTRFRGQHDGLSSEQIEKRLQSISMPRAPQSVSILAEHNDGQVMMTFTCEDFAQLLVSREHGRDGAAL